MTLASHTQELTIKAQPPLLGQMLTTDQVHCSGTFSPLCLYIRLRKLEVPGGHMKSSVVQPLILALKHGSRSKFIPEKFQEKRQARISLLT